MKRGLFDGGLRIFNKRARTGFARGPPRTQSVPPGELPLEVTHNNTNPPGQTTEPPLSHSHPVEVPSIRPAPDLPQRGLSPPEELVINYIRGISNNTGVSFDEVAISTPVRKYAEKMGVDIDNIITRQAGE